MIIIAIWKKRTNIRDHGADSVAFVLLLFENENFLIKNKLADAEFSN